MRHTMLTMLTVLTTTTVVLLLCQGASAATFYITTNSDMPDVNLSDGVCGTYNGNCSLRAAFMQANYYSGGDTIYDTHGWTINVSSPLEVSSTITFYGDGSDGSGTNIDGGDSVEVFRILSPPNTTHVPFLTMEDVQIRDGRRNITVEPDARLRLVGCAVVEGRSDFGGGIFAEDAIVVLEQSSVRQNHATDDGGGIYYAAGDHTKYLQLLQSDLTSNTTSGNGGGIHALVVNSVVNLTNSRLSNNQAALGWGGAIFAQLAQVWMLDTTLNNNLAQLGGGLYSTIGTVRIVQSSIWGNIASLGGGGLYLTMGLLSPFEVINTTISGNSTSGSGGGIYLNTSDDSWVGLELSNSTITGNTADLNTDDVGDGGGIYREGDWEPFIMQNTIVADNNDLSSSGYLPDCVGRINTRGYNIVGIKTPECIMAGDHTGDQKGTVASPIDPMLGSRTDEPYNAYHPVLEGSPAVDAGNPAGCTEWGSGTLLGNDQIGEMRTFGASCDSGSIESPFSTAMWWLDVSLAGSGSGSVSSAPLGISCPTDCEQEYLTGQWVTLTQFPYGYYNYSAGFTGDPDCADGSVHMTTNVSCTAVFNRHPTHDFTLLHEGSGIGAVLVEYDQYDAMCDDDCTLELVDGEEITLLPIPLSQSTFLGFGGDPDCADGAVTLGADTTCTATFDLGGDTIFTDGFESGNTSDWSSTTP